MKILKFGGTSVGSAPAIKNILDIVSRRYNTPQQVAEPMAVVCSAVSGVTNLLLAAAHHAAQGNHDAYHQNLNEIRQKHLHIIDDLLQSADVFVPVFEANFVELTEILHSIFLLHEASDRSLDLVASFGERLSCLLITAAFNEKNIAAEYLDARKIIVTNGDFMQAGVLFDATNARIVQHFEAHTDLQIVTGFVAATADGATTTLGRGGSDYTAAILGAALHATTIEIWTDVNGMLTADPRIVPDAFTQPHVSYTEAMELSHFGAKVIYPPTLYPAFALNIPIIIKNTFEPQHNGTTISNDIPPINPKNAPIKGISSIAQITLANLTGSGMVGVAGISGRLFAALAQAKVNVILITQASSEHSICFAIAQTDAEKAQNIVAQAFEYEIHLGKIAPLEITNDNAIVAAVGESMSHAHGMAGKMFGALGNNGINVIAIAQGSSEHNISAVIPKTDLAKALNVLHQAFFTGTKTLNLFVIGVGLIGETLLKQLYQQQGYLQKNLALKINLAGVANSKQMYFDAKGIDMQHYKQALTQGSPTDISGFVAQMRLMNLPHTIFIDNTAGGVVVPHYQNILEANISIATPNKIANSGSLAQYHALKTAAQQHKVKFLYETNVGAGLPVISTLTDLMQSGDEILKIEAVLSGTISYIFNTFDANNTFSNVVQAAKNLGYTEPDPRDDLSGTDIARKILILARETGLQLEPHDITVENMLPEACTNAASVAEFFETLEKYNDYFELKRFQADCEGKKLRFIACLENQKAYITLQAVDAHHPFYNLAGSDNIIAFSTARYHSTPLVIKGPGAGAEVTAAGVFANIINIGNYLG